MTEKLEFTATDMATAAAEGFRDGQRAALTEATNNTGALLPCPFCGGEARLDQRVTQSLWNSGDAVFSRAACDECDISGQDFCDDPTGEEAIEWWNRRATPPAAAVVRDAFMKMRNVAAGYSNCCEFDSANTRRLEREFEAADELYRSAAAPTPEPASPEAVERGNQSDNIRHLTHCDVSGCGRCENLMYFFQACDECGTWGHHDAGPCQCLSAEGKAAPEQPAKEVLP